jgi:hypothetical protein
MMSFNQFLEECKDELNHHQQNVKTSFEVGWKPLFDEYRTNKKLQNKPGNRQIVLQGLDEYNLSDEEAFFILSYTGSYSSWLNNDWRNGWSFDSKCKQYFAERLNLALDKLPCFNDEYVFRMDSPMGTKDQVIKWFHNQIKQVIHVPHFLSTSKDNYENTEITWHIKTMSNNSMARDLALLTNNKVEKEVLFKNDCYFQIVNINSEKGIIDMEEVPATLP